MKLRNASLWCATIAVVLTAIWIAGRFVPRTPKPVAIDTAQRPLFVAGASADGSSTPSTQPANVNQGTNDSWRASAQELLATRQDRRWQQPVEERDFARFKDWAERFRRGEAGEEEGVRLATRRRTAMADLMQNDPERAIRLAVPETVRRQLPARVTGLLEKPVNGIGNVEMFGAIPDEGGKLGIPSIQRFAEVGGERYEAFVYGRRLGQPSRWSIPLHGYAVDGIVALSDSPARVLEPVEQAEARAGLPADPVCSVSGQDTQVNQDEVALDLGEEVVFLCSGSHAIQVTASIADGEDALPPGAGNPEKGGVTSDYASTGNRTMIMIRVGFSDYAGQPVSQADGTNAMIAMKDKFADWSYGRFTLAAPGAGSVVTPLYIMPTTAAGYDGNSSQLHFDARAAATNDGYNASSYDFIMVCFAGGTPGFSYGGLGQVGARNSWIRSSSLNGTAGIGTHEVGHNFGLMHASYYDAPDTSVIAPGGERIEYGDPYDTMGGASTNNPFSVRHKQYLGWVTNVGATEFIALTSGSTTNRIYAHDNDTATGYVRGVRIDRSASLATSSDQKYYWLEYRTQDNRWSDDGVQIRWAGGGNQRPQLLDMTPDSTNDLNDAALLIGRTFTDTNYGIHITPILRGSGAPDPDWIDAVVRYGTFPGNQAPTLSIAASATNVGTGVTINFTATASDPDGDQLAYFWDFGDNNYSSNGNSPNAAKSYGSAGERLVQCTVSDMKGQIAIASLVVRIGNPSTFRITGRAMLHDQPMMNARINASTDGDSDLSDDRHTFTDSDGYYSLVGLPAATNYVVTARHEDHVFIRQNFTNPVAVGPTKTNIDFLGGVPTMTTMATRQMNWNTTNGPVPVTIYDYESQASNLTLTAFSGNTNVVPANAFTFSGTGTNRTFTVKLLTNVAAAVTNKIVVTDLNGFSVTNNFILQVNAPASATAVTNSPNEDTQAVVDLWPRLTDPAPLATADSNLVIAVSGASNGVVTLVSNRFAQFNPPTNYFGPASFTFTARDKGYDPRLLFYYDFEPTDTTGDNASSDRSGNARNGTLDRDGTGSYAYVTNDVPPALQNLSIASLSLTDNGNSNSARLYRTIRTSEYNLNNADWSFTTWFKRDTSTNDDFIFYTGPSTGNGSSDEELQIYLQSGNNRVRVRLYNVTNGIDMELLGPTTAVTGAWHHVALTYDRTNTNRGDFRLYFNGALAASSNAIFFNALQTNIVIGGHNGTNTTQRWFNGSFDEVALWKAVLPAAGIAELQTNIISYVGGLSSTNVITLNYQPVNDPPVLTGITNRIVNPGVTVAVTNNATDPEVPGTQLLSYQIVSGPTNASVNPTNGLFSWRPSIAQAASNHVIALRVVDNGSPVLSSTQLFSVTVNPASPAQVASMTMPAGQMQFSISGQSGPDYIVQATTNMVTWTNLLVTNPVSFPFNWSDPNAAAFSNRFYRVLLGP